MLEDEATARMRARPISEVTSRRVRKVHRRMVKMGRAITPDSPPEEYHELRKKGKELRYLLELFAMPLFDRRGRQADDQELKGLQDVLGLHQDREVQIEMLKEIGRELVSKPGGAGALMAIGDADRAARGRRASGPRKFRGAASPSSRPRHNASSWLRSSAMSFAIPEPMSKPKRDTRVLATYNIKGGVGKTSAAV